MPTFAFEVMSPEQAASFAATDSLLVANPSVNRSNVGVSFSGDTVTLTSGGRSLTLGAAFTGQVRSIMPAGAPGLILGSPGADAITGYIVAHNIHPDLDGDLLYGRGGDDTLDGSLGSDTLSGGAGADVFVFRAGSDSDVVVDFESVDRLAMGAGALDPAQYLESAQPTMAAASSYAFGEINAGRAKVVAVQLGDDVRVYAANPQSTTVGNVITLQHTTLDQLDRTNFVALPEVAAPAPVAATHFDAPPPIAPPNLPGVSPTPPIVPAAPAASPDGAATAPGPRAFSFPADAVAVIQGDMDRIHLADLQGGDVAEGTTTRTVLERFDLGARIDGTDLTYDSLGQLTGGVVKGLGLTTTHGGDISLAASIRGVISASTFEHWVAVDATQDAFATLFGGGDDLTGGAGADLIRGYGGNDLINTGGGNDTVFAGVGNDVVYVAASAGGSNYLRGDEGDDWIAGGAAFDDINGNMGNDTETGGLGDDWVVGGKDSDLLFGDAGNDLVYGNIGADTCEGGAGNDTVRGGQDNDVVRGFSGDDFVSGDKGDDTMTGGAGADLFHTFGDAGVDRVTDFNAAEGDRVLLDPGTQYQVAQSGADTVISMTGGGQMILVGVQMSSLPTGWIFGT